MRGALLCSLLISLTTAGCMSDEADTLSPYAGLEGSPIRGLSPEEIVALRTGQGAGLALPAELNGYPGPKHVLDLAGQLDLTAEQVQAVQRIRETMLGAAVPAGERVLAAHAALEGAFRNGTIEPTTLSQLTASLAEAEAELRAIHLQAHLDTKAVLTRHQVVLYGDLRGYTGSDGHERAPHDP